MGGATYWHFPTWSQSYVLLSTKMSVLLHLVSSVAWAYINLLTCKTEAKSTNKNVVVNLPNANPGFSLVGDVWGLLAAFSAFVKSRRNSASVVLLPFDPAAAACAYCWVSSCHCIVAFGFSCFRIVFFKVSTMHQRLEMHSACRECTSSSTVIKEVQETEHSLRNHAVLPHELSSDTQGL